MKWMTIPAAVMAPITAVVALAQDTTAGPQASALAQDNTSAGFQAPPSVLQVPQSTVPVGPQGPLESCPPVGVIFGAYWLQQWPGVWIPGRNVGSSTVRATSYAELAEQRDRYIGECKTAGQAMENESKTALNNQRNSFIGAILRQLSCPSWTCDFGSESEPESGSQYLRPDEVADITAWYRMKIGACQSHFTDRFEKVKGRWDLLCQ